MTFADLLPAQREMLVGVIRQRSFGMPVSVWELIRRRLERFDESVLRAEKQGVFRAVDGTSTDMFAIVHESRSRSGDITKTKLGNLQRKVSQ